MFLKLVTHQARHRWTIALLLWLSMTSLVSLYTFLRNSAAYSNRSMQLIMKRMGHNLLILPRQADPLDTYLCTDNQQTFEADVTARMGRNRGLASKYYVSVLQQQVTVKGRRVLLTGILPVRGPGETREKGNMVAPVPPGRARLGSEAARLVSAAEGDRIEVLGKSFDVSRVLPPEGTLDDHRIYVDLAACQDLLCRPGQINVVLAFLCMHDGDLPRALRQQDESMAKHFAGFRTIPQMDIAQGRDLARRTTHRYLYYVVGLVFCATVIVIAITGLHEVAERRRETGILLAMGASYPYIVGLYVAKLLAIAAVAAVTGFLVGSALSSRLLAPVLVTNTQPISVTWSQLPEVVALTCLVAVVAQCIPMARLLRMNPNTILTEE